MGNGGDLDGTQPKVLSTEVKRKEVFSVVREHLLCDSKAKKAMSFTLGDRWVIPWSSLRASSVALKRQHRQGVDRSEIS